MKGSFIRASAMISVAVGALVLPNSVQAQNAQENAAQEDTNNSDAKAGDIVVTAQFRGQRVQDTPLAISAVTGELADARSQYSINDVARSAPSVNIEAGTGTGGAFPSVYIRGIGQSDPFPPLDPGVGVYIDDIYYGILTGANFDLLDLDRVEISRGPQGTLTGKNSEGGAIKIFTTQPSNDLGGYVEGTYGSYNRMQLRGAMNIPLVDDKVLLRVSGMARSVDGFFKRLDYGCVNPGTLPLSNGVSATGNCEIGRSGGGDLAAFKGTLLIKPTDNVRNTTSYTSITDNQQLQPLKLLFQSSSWAGRLNFITGPREMTSYATHRGDDFPGGQAYQGIDESRVRQEVFSNTLNIDIAKNLAFTSITGYVTTDSQGSYDNDLSPISVSLQDIIVHSKQFTQEFRLSGASSLVDWTLGAYYFDNDILFPGRININRGFGFAPGAVLGIPGFQLDIITNDVIESRSKSGFAHAVFHLTDSLNLTGGLRYTDDAKSYTFVRGLPGSVGNDGLSTSPSLFSEKRWDYRAAIDYRFSDELLVYAQVATGYKGGGVNPRPILAGQEVPYGAETVESYEAGFKADLFDRSVRLNVTGFYQNFDNIQLRLNRCDFVPGTPPGGPCALSTNAGAATIKGAEAEFDFEPIDGLNINASGSVVDFEFTEVNPDSGVLLTSMAPFISKYKFSVGAQYEIAAFGGTLTPRLDLDYRSKFSVGAPANAPEFNINDGRALVNARVTYEPDGSDWQLSLAATNLFDKFYYASQYDQASESQGATAEGLVGRPREVFVTVKRKF
jgi:iron complex outermembrane receptor protein